MRRLVYAASFASLTVLHGCSQNPSVDISFNPLESIKIPTIIGTIELNFGKEKQRIAASTGDLEKRSSADSPDSLRFREYDFNTGPLPQGCKPFESASYGRLAFPDDGKAVDGIREKIKNLKEHGFAPDEAIIALATYDAIAFRAYCADRTWAKLKVGSKINGLRLNRQAVELFKSKGQAEIEVTPRITIIALSKQEFQGRLKPTAANLLLSMFRFELPPNTDSLSSDPNTGATVLAYSEKLEDVILGTSTRHVLAGGSLRIFVGKTYIYLIDVYTNTAGITEKQWKTYQDFVESFRYVGQKMEP